MLTQTGEYGHKIEEKVKAMQSEIKENAQATNSDRKETETQMNGMEQNEEISIQQEQKEATRFQKNEGRLRNLQDNFKHYNIWIIAVTEEDHEQEIENLFENITKENFLNLAKEIDFRKFRKLRESQRSWIQGSTHQGTSPLPKTQD